MSRAGAEGERDPRVTPRMGDVVRKGRVIRTVEGVVVNTVNWNWNKWAWLTTWQKWAKNATVVKRGDAAGGRKA